MASTDTDDHAGIYAVALDALTTGRMTVAQAQEQHATSVRLYGAEDGQSIGYQRAITRHLSDPLEPVTAAAPFPTLSTVHPDEQTCDLCGRVQSPGVDCCAPDDEARPNRFAALWAVVVVLVALVSLAINVGPGVGALVDYATHHAATTTVAAPSAPLTSPVSLEEDSPGWDCRTMGNRWCGEGAPGGPLVDVTTGWVSCPRGGDLYDATTGDVPPGVTPPGEVCRYGGA